MKSYFEHIILETGSNILTEDGDVIINEDQGFITRGQKIDFYLREGGIVLAE